MVPLSSFALMSLLFPRCKLLLSKFALADFIHYVAFISLPGLAHVLPSPFLLLGDYNGRHALWDGGASNPRGILIASFIEDEGLELLNNGYVTHFLNHGRALLAGA